MDLKILPLLLCQRGKCHQGSQDTSSNPQVGHGHTIANTLLHTIKNSPIQNQDTIQAWTRTIHSRLVVMM